MVVDGSHGRLIGAIIGGVQRGVLKSAPVPTYLGDALPRSGGPAPAMPANVETQLSVRVLDEVRPTGEQGGKALSWSQSYGTRLKAS